MTLKALIVGTGRCGTLSLTKWFNDLFACNQLNAKAMHEYLALECYNAFDAFYKTNQEELLQALVYQIYHSHVDVIIGNGYASLLPYFASMDKNIILIHLERKDREKCIKSLMNNARHFPFAYQYYVPDEAITSDDKIARTTAFHVGETTVDEWNSWSLEKKLSWYYDYTHQTITKYNSLFTNSKHIYTEELNDQNCLSELAKFSFPKATNIPAMLKINSHVIIEDVPPQYKNFANWLFRSMEWDKVVSDPSYLVSYAIEQLDTWVSWCGSKNNNAKAICPENNLNPEELKLLLNKIIPILEKRTDNLRYWLKK
jgi:hypothetical protein